MSNFAFLEQDAPWLARHARAAERTVHADPNTCLVKLRQFAETLAKLVAARCGMETDRRLVELLDALARGQVTDRETARRLRRLRRLGNRAVHEAHDDADDAHEALRSAHTLAVWWYATIGGDRSVPEGFRLPCIRDIGAADDESACDDDDGDLKPVLDALAASPVPLIPNVDEPPTEQLELGLAVNLDALLDDIVEQASRDSNGEPRVWRRAHGPARKTRRALKTPFHPSLLPAFHQLTGGHRPYGHQVQAWNALLDGRSLVITTPTASGKTLAFNLPVVHSVLEGGTALYLFPLNELARDQALSLRRLLYEAKQDIPVDEFHGVPAERWTEERARDQRHLVLTTPESLQWKLLCNGFENVKEFFRRLRYVVVDEAHEYSGVFGSNMALLLRRVLMKVWACGGEPDAVQFVISSATIANPVEHARRLVGPTVDDWELVSKSSAGTPSRTEIAVLASSKWIVHLFARLLAATTHDPVEGERPVRTILFCRSKTQISRVADAVRRQLADDGRAELSRSFAEFTADTVKADPTLSERLRSGELQSVIATNKLAAGIDIGSLDVAVVFGFQGKMLTMRQMFGRAARRGAGAWIFVGRRGDPDDQYLVDSAPAVFECPDPEEAVIDLDNRGLIRSHQRCLISAHPSDRRFQEWHRDPDLGLVEKLFGTVHRDVEPWDSTREPTPWEQHPFTGLQLRGAKPLRSYVVRTTEGTHVNPVDELTAFGERHRGARFRENGVDYEVELLDTTSALVTVRCAPDDGRATSCWPRLEVEVVDAKAPAMFGPIEARAERVKVTRRYQQYVVYRQEESWTCNVLGCEVRGARGEQCPTHHRRLRVHREWQIERKEPIEQELVHSLLTVGVRLRLGPIVKRLSEGIAPTDSRAEVEGEALIGLRNVFLSAWPDAFLTEGDIVDGVLLEGGDVVFFDEFPWGIGIAERLASDRDGRLLDRALARVRACRCPAGCRSCVSPFQKAIRGERGHKRLTECVLAWLTRGAEAPDRPLPKSGDPVEAVIEALSEAVIEALSPR